MKSSHELQMNRRRAITTLGGAALAARALSAQKPPTEKPGTPKPGARVTPDIEKDRMKAGAPPLLCLYSGCLAKIPFPQLPDIVGGMGYDGMDLTVMKGGHVDPSQYMVFLDRAFQTFQDAGLEVPMVTTSFTSPSQVYAYPIFSVSGQLGARFCRLGTWPPPDASGGGAGPRMTGMRAMAARNELAQFAAMGVQCRIMPLLANHAGSYPGRSIAEAETLLTGVPPKAFGYCFDPVQAILEAGAADGWEAALQAALPRLGAVALSDIALDRDDGGALKPRPCPLGEGVIDWKKFFLTLAAARFHGPISMHMDYKTQSDINSLKKDLVFARARVQEAWPG